MATYATISGLLITFQKNLNYPETVEHLNLIYRADLASYLETFVDPTNPDVVKDTPALLCSRMLSRMRSFCPVLIL